MKNLKTILSMIIVGCCVFIPMMNVEASTVDNVEYPGSNVTVDDLGENKYKVTLTGNADEDFEVLAGQTVTLDLAGFTLTNYLQDGQKAPCEAIKVDRGGVLTIIDSVGTGTVTNLVQSTYGPITNYGTLIIESGNFTTSTDTYVVRNEGINLTINGGIFTTNSQTTSLIGNIKYNENSADLPTMTINGGTFEAVQDTIRNNENTAVTITNGTFNSQKTFALDNLGTATVTGGTFTSVENSAIRHQIDSTNKDFSSLNITNATLNSATDKTDYAIYDRAVNKDVTDDYNVTTDDDGNLVLEELTPVTDVPETPEEVKNEVENPETSDGVLIFLSLTAIGFAGTALAFRRLHN